MRNIILVIILILTVPSANADWMHLMVGFKCDTDKDIAYSYYKGVYNEAGQEMIENLKENEWSVWELVKKNNTHITKIIKKTKKCTLSDGEVTFVISPNPGNKNLMGGCGMGMSAYVIINKNNKQLIRKGFEHPCWGADKNSLSKIGYSGKDKKVFTELQNISGT